jgi:hypothetical protein
MFFNFKNNNLIMILLLLLVIASSLCYISMQNNIETFVNPSFFDKYFSIVDSDDKYNYYSLKPSGNCNQVNFNLNTPISSNFAKNEIVYTNVSDINKHMFDNGYQFYYIDGDNLIFYKLNSDDNLEINLLDDTTCGADSIGNSTLDESVHETTDDSDDSTLVDPVIDSQTDSTTTDSTVSETTEATSMKAPETQKLVNISPNINKGQPPPKEQEKETQAAPIEPVSPGLPDIPSTVPETTDSTKTTEPAENKANEEDEDKPKTDSITEGFTNLFSKLFSKDVKEGMDNVTHKSGNLLFKTGKDDYSKIYDSDDKVINITIKSNDIVLVQNGELKVIPTSAKVQPEEKEEEKDGGSLDITTATGGSISMGDINIPVGKVGGGKGFGAHHGAHRGHHGRKGRHSYLLDDGSSGLGSLSEYKPPPYSDFEGAMNNPSNPIVNPVNSMNPLEYSQTLFAPTTKPMMEKTSSTNCSADNSEKINRREPSSPREPSGPRELREEKSDSGYPACPSCERCPEPSFECKKVPAYEQGTANAFIPRPVLADFSTFAM